MKTFRLLRVLGWWLVAGLAPAGGAAPGPAATPLPSPAPPTSPATSPDSDSTFVRLTATQVLGKATPQLGQLQRWRYQPGTPPGWASPATDDRAWPLARPTFRFGQGPPGWRGLGCFRLRFALDTALLGQPLGLRMEQEGASEIYLDGRLLDRYGTVGASAAATHGFQPAHCTLPLMLTTAGPHLLAVRYARYTPWPTPSDGFKVWAGPARRFVAENVALMRRDSLTLICTVGAGVLALLHFFLFLFYRPQRANFYYSLYMSGAAATSLMVYVRWTHMDADTRWWAQLGFLVGAAASIVPLLAFIYAVCRMALPRRWLALLALAGAAHVGLWLAWPGWNFVPTLAAVYLVAALDMLRVLGQALRRRQPGVGLVALGALCTILVNVFAVGDPLSLWGSHYSPVQHVIVLGGFLLLPICTSVYLARDFASTRRDLEVQLRQVEQLSAQTLAQEVERRQLVSAQNERLEATVQARTEEIQRQNHLLAGQRDEIAGQAAQLRELDRSKTRFFTNITHEFRTPLTLLLGPAGQILSQTQEPATRQQAELVERNARRLLHLINQLLDLSKLEVGQQALHPAPAELVGFVRGLVGAFESLAQQRGIAVGFQADRPALPVEFDADKLEKIVVNLLSNAFKFTPDGGQVRVALRALPTPAADLAAAAPERPVAPDDLVWLELEVADTGRGIAAAQLPHVFDRFYQADASDTREQEGTGIGLALTRELVELHGGRIELRSQLGQGTTARVRLPLRRASAPAAAEAALPAATTAASGVAEPAVAPLRAGPAGAVSQLWGPASADPADTLAAAAVPAEVPLVLLIDDNADMRAYLRAALGADYQLLEAAHGEAGVAAAREQLPDLVLTDAMMPRLDGYGVCQQLKQDERTSHIPVVMLTARADLPSRLQGLDTGADAYLTKPFQRQELLAQLANLIRGRQQLQAAYRRAATAPLPAPALPTLEQAFLDKVRAAVEQRLDDEALDVEQLARELALSRTQLHRKLKALTGQAPGDFIRAVRLHRAHQLLVAGAATVAEVAYRVGYGSPANFSTSFSRHFGYAPSEARRREAARQQ